MEQKFRVEFLEAAKKFLDNLEEKSREKIYYNVWKATQINDNELFKKLKVDIWEFRTLYNKIHFRLFAFQDKTSNANTVVISTHGLIKKTDKIPNGEFDRAESLRIQYFNDKNKKK